MNKSLLLLNLYSSIIIQNPVIYQIRRKQKNFYWVMIPRWQNIEGASCPSLGKDSFLKNGESAISEKSKEKNCKGNCTQVRGTWWLYTEGVDTQYKHKHNTGPQQQIWRTRWDHMAAARATGNKDAERAWHDFGLEPCGRQCTYQAREKKKGGQETGFSLSHQHSVTSRERAGTILEIHNCFSVKI